LETQLLKKQLIPRSSIEDGAKLMIDEDPEEKISGDSGELAGHNFDLLLAFLGADDEPSPSSVLVLALALAFSITALLSSRKAKSTMLR
jgi:hypothetical protein